MDAGAVVVRDAPAGAAPPVCAGETLRAERAVFTSVRSALGEGYRLIACSPGLSGEQRQELTRRCPSHGGLCDPSPSGRGWASLPLESGGHAVVVTCCAGAEHTARGGGRIYSQIGVLDDAAFARFGFEPQRVRAALAAWEREPPLTAPAATLSTLAIPAPPARRRRAADGPRPSLSPSDLLRLGWILRELLGRRGVIVNGAPAPESRLRFLVAAAPLALRRSLSLSIGLTHAPSRPVRLAFVNGPTAALQRWADGADAVLVDWSAPVQCAPSQFDPWLELVMELWSAGRLADLDRLSLSMRRANTTEQLNRAAALRSRLVAAASA
jgi:hypothetical protein